MNATGIAGRRAALAAVDEKCPRCSSPRDDRAEYCADCGLRLPAVRGAVPALRRRWLRRGGWYPGDWIWMALVTLAVAAAGTAGSIVVTDRRTPAHRATFVATGALPASTATSPTSRGTNGSLHWPAALDGWTIVLGSFPLPRSRPNARAAADHAARLGLPQVGTLDSSRWPSLNPGYDVVFSGIYRTLSEAQAALTRVRHAGFGGAYSRQIAR